MRIGLISDLHWTQEPPASAPGWHGAGADFAGVPARIAAAIGHFAEADVDMVAVCGDLAHHGDLGSLAAALGLLARAEVPVVVVAGNHDVSEGPGRLGEALARAGGATVSLATPTGIEFAGLPVAGVQVGESSGWFRARLAAAPSPAAWGEGPLVLLSHYPVLSLAAEVAARGLPYPGDLLDRAGLEQALIARGAPTVVLSGHVHVRVTRRAGPVLQLSAGALVEPPYECAVIDIVAGAAELSVIRRCRALREAPGQDVTAFVPDEEEWRFAGADWEPVRTSTAGEAVAR